MAAVTSCENTLLVFQNNETAAMLMFQTIPVGVELFFSCERFLLFNKFAKMLST